MTTSPLDQPGGRPRAAGAVDKCVRLLRDSYLSSFSWFDLWVDELRADGTLARLAEAGDAGPVTSAVSVLEALDGRDAPVLLPDLATEVTGDATALADDTALSALVLRALALRLGVSQPENAEGRRDLWDEFDVVLDDLGSRVLVLGLHAAGSGLGEWLTSAAGLGTPFCVTLQQLLALPIEVREPVVYVCRDPAVLRGAASSLGSLSLPLICTEGLPSTAFHRLADAVTDGDGELRYHGDFDWPGISAAATVMARHGAVPWRYGASDYQAGLRAESGQVPLSGAPQPTPWDEGLATAMSLAGRVVREETVTDALLSDLQA